MHFSSKALYALSLVALFCHGGLYGKVDAKSKRTPDYEIDEQFLSRQAKYNLERTLTNEQMQSQLMRLFEAARWSASCFNNQPWFFIYALHGTKEWNVLFNLISSFNQAWAKNAGALILIISRHNYERTDKLAATHSLDTGIAVSNMLLQASNSGIVAHPMEIFNYEKAQRDCAISKNYTVEVMIAVGEEASEEGGNKELAERDERVTHRKPVSEFAFEGHLPKHMKARVEKKSKAPRYQKRTPKKR